MNISVFPSGTATVPSETLPLDKLLTRTQSGYYRNQVEAVRRAADKAIRAQLKKQLPSATVSGTFSRRAKDGLNEHSGCLALDIDAEPNPGFTVAIDRKRIEADPYTYAGFVSAGGAGYCVIVRIPTEDHEASFRALETYYREELGLQIDTACKDVSRLRFVSYDPLLFRNEEAAVFDVVEAAPAPPQPAPAPAAPAYTPRRTASGEGYGQAALQRACDKIRLAPDGEKRTVLNKMAYLCGGYIATGFLAEHEAREALRAAILSREIEDEKQALRTIEEGLKDGQQKPILPDALQYHVRRELRASKPAADIATLVATAHGLPLDTTTAAVVAVKEEQRQEVSLLTFWSVEDPGKDKPLKLLLSVHGFRAWLAYAGGFRKHADETAPGGYTWVRVAEKVVRRVVVGEMVSFLTDYLSELPFEFDGVYRSQLEEAVALRQRLLFDPLGLLSLPDLAGSFLQDTAHAHYAFYQNGWVEVTAAGCELRLYEELPGLIWESQRKQRPFQVMPAHVAQAADFHHFTVHLTAGDPERLDQLQRALGYLIHSYKDETNPRAVILMDETGEVGRSSGGTGKGLLMKAVGHMTALSIIGAANFDVNDTFRYQLMTDGARVLFLDEWKPLRNSFDLLFADITNGFAVNRKYQLPKNLSFDEAPKFVLASNDIVTGDDESSARRKVEIALAKRYTSQFTPKDDFGRGFFGKHWDADEWLRFDNLALGWVQHFLANDKQHLLLKNESIAARGLVQSVGIGFHEFAQELIETARASQSSAAEFGLTEDARIWAADAFLAYQTATGDRRTGAISFNRKLEALGLQKGKCRERGPRQDQTYFTLPAD